MINATGNGRAATRWALSPGWYVLRLNQKKPAAGILDLTLGPPGLIPPAPEPPGPPGPVLPLGVQSADTGSSLRLVTNSVPGMVGGLQLRDVPPELDDGPLVLTLPAGETQTLQVHTAHAGTLVVRDIAVGPPIEQHAVAAASETSVTLPAADHARTLAVAWLPPATPVAPAPSPPPELTALRDNAPVFLDLAREQQASFALQVAQGGLFGVTTLGRLRTEGTLGTSFVPELDRAQGNGVGANMLLQRYLRAGRYRLNVTARDSAGHLGVVAAPARLAEGATLLAGLSVRASLPAGTGVAFPLRIARAGNYRLDLLGLGGPFAARLEDAEGWPLLREGDLNGLERDFRPGAYRLIVQPPAVAARAVARLARIVPAPAIEGHGPHVLPFDAAQSATWREPVSRGAPRTPDRWTFALAGPAKITLDLTGEGMAAVLRADAPDAKPLGHVDGDGKLQQTLPAGRYVVEARALERNDRLDYSLTLNSEELQPDVPRTVQLPADLPFALAEPRVVSLTSFGSIPLRAVLRAADGGVLASVAERTDDWNIALSRPLPAGRYRLKVAALAPAVAAKAPESGDPDPSQSADQNAMGMPGPNPGGPGLTPYTPAARAPATLHRHHRHRDDTDTTDTAANIAPAVGAPATPGTTEITLALAADLADETLAKDGSAALAGAGVHHLILPTAAPVTLRIVAAEAPVEVTLAVEARTPDGAWRRIGQDQGLAPLLAIPGDGGTWRALVWSVDGANAPIRLATTLADAPAQALGDAHFLPAPLARLTTQWGVAHLYDPGAATLEVTGPGTPLFAATALGDAATRVDASDPARPARVYATSEQVWLVTRMPGATAAAFAQAARLPANSQTGLDLPAGGRARFPLAANAADATCAFVASGIGRPGLDAGRAMGVAGSSAFGLCGGDRLAVWNAGGRDALRMTLHRYQLALAPVRPVDLAFSGTVAAHAALPLHLPPGTKRLDASLAAGSALVAGWTAPGAVTAWTGSAPLTRSLAGDWTDILLVNTADTPAPAAVAALPVDATKPLAGGAVIGRFYGADGSFVLPVKARPGQRLLLAGAASATVLRADGQVREGGDLALGDGAATVVITHRTGAVALWLEGDGASPWDDAAPQDVALPAQVTLAGRTMALRLSRAAPALLHLRSTAPLILALGGARPMLFGQGATTDRYVAGGETVLRLLSPQDGPLSGTLELSVTPVAELVEGTGAPVAVGPGGAALFGFRVTAEGPVGLGVRANPDRVSARLLDDTGRELAHGVTLLHRLTPGHYLLEASVPPGAPTTMLRPTVLGIVPHRTPPPPELVRSLLIEAGFAPPDAAH